MITVQSSTNPTINHMVLDLQYGARNVIIQNIRVGLLEPLVKLKATPGVFRSEYNWT